MPRVIAGTARGRRLEAPVGTLTRPTSDRTREALFSALEAMVLPWGARRFLDLYAGSGAVGLEAASRGAAAVVLVEQAPPALAVLRRNVSTLGLAGVEVEATRVERFVTTAAARGAFDVVFADPPYSMPANELAAVITALHAGGALSSEAVVVVERSARDAAWVWPESFTGLRERRYGQATVWYGRAATHA